MIIINDTLGTYGGSITLIERLCIYATSENESIKIYCNDVSNKEIVKKLNQLEVKIECFDTYNHKLLEKHIKTDLLKENIQVISFIMNNYLSVEKVKYLDKLDFVNVIYSIHPATFYKGTGIRNAFFKGLVIKRYKKTIQKLNINDAILFMDQDNVDKAESYYSIHLEKTHIQALPMICKPLDDGVLEEKIDKSYNNKIIITSCRADFPYKGYLFGLIDDFVKLSEQNKNLKLIIVCSGDKEDVARVRSKISKVPDRYRGKISFHSWMKYQELLKLISTSYMYIGMGTGVLDSAFSYVPAIAVKYNTYENLADCVLYERPDYVVADEHCTVGAINIMEKLLACSRQEYGQVALKCYEGARNIYAMENFFSYIKALNRNPSFLSYMDIIIHTLNTWINSMKKERSYDVNNIEYEKGDENS